MKNFNEKIFKELMLNDCDKFVAKEGGNKEEALKSLICEYFKDLEILFGIKGDCLEAYIYPSDKCKELSPLQRDIFRNLKFIGDYLGVNLKAYLEDF